MATMGDGRPDNSPGDLSALLKAYQAARAQGIPPVILDISPPTAANSAKP
jgi:hypothetical protein